MSYIQRLRYGHDDISDQICAWMGMSVRSQMVSVDLFQDYQTRFKTLFMKPTIGMFKGKFLEDMDKSELLDFAAWAANRIQELQKIADKHYELDLEAEVLTNKYHE